LRKTCFPSKKRNPVSLDNLLPDTRSDLERTAVSQSHQTQSHDSSSHTLDVNSVDLSSDDDEVENLLDQVFEDVQTKSVPSFNPLSSLPVRGSSEWTVSGPLPVGDGGENEEIEEDTRDIGSADDFEEEDISPHSVIYRPIGSTKQCSKVNQPTSRRPTKILALFVFLVYIRQNPLSRKRDLPKVDLLPDGGESRVL
jgi:hypothetical protein